MSVAMTSEKIEELAAALAKAQGEFPIIEKNKTATVKAREGRQGYSYKYADLADVIESVKSVLSKYALSHSQEIITTDKDVFLLTTVMHESGQWRSGTIPLPSALLGDPQKFGTVITYYRRYALCAALGVQAEEDKDAPVDQAEEPKQPPKTIISSGNAPAKKTANDLAKLISVAKIHLWQEDSLIEFTRAKFKVARPSELGPRAFAELLDIVGKKHFAAAMNDLGNATPQTVASKAVDEEEAPWEKELREGS